MKIYLDNAATTIVDKEVVKEMNKYFLKDFGNASSLHEEGTKAKNALENSRNIIAKFINAENEEIIFTSSGTESNNLALKGLAEAYPHKKHIITSVIEHPAILECCNYLKNKGYKIDYISVNSEGIVSISELKNKISSDTLLVSIMHVNNEIGTIQPIEEIGKICREKDIFFHTDAVQSLGKLKIDVKKMNIDLLSASSHKINGPKGVGMLFIRKGINLTPQLHGGGQENNKRSSTENVPGIVGFAKAIELSKSKTENKVKEIRDYMIKNLLKINDSKLNGSKDKRIFNNINLVFRNVEGEALLMLLDKAGISSSTGSACSSHSLHASHVLLAIGLGEEEAHGSIRLSLPWTINKKQADYVIKVMTKSVSRLREVYGK